MRRVTPARRLDSRLVPATALAALIGLGCQAPPTTLNIVNQTGSVVEVETATGTRSEIRPREERTLNHEGGLVRGRITVVPRARAEDNPAAGAKHTGCSSKGTKP